MDITTLVLAKEYTEQMSIPVIDITTEVELPSTSSQEYKANALSETETAAIITVLRRKTPFALRIANLGMTVMFTFVSCEEEEGMISAQCVQGFGDIIITLTCDEQNKISILELPYL